MTSFPILLIRELHRKLWGGFELAIKRLLTKPGLTRNALLHDGEGRHSFISSLSFLFRFLERLVRSLVFINLKGRLHGTHPHTLIPADTTIVYGPEGMGWSCDVCGMTGNQLRRCVNHAKKFW